MSVGNPIFRFMLIHEIEGSYEITEPQGWKEAKIQLERDPQFHSLVEKFTGGFSFYGSNGVDDGGINFIRMIENIYGIDADLTVDIDVSFDSGVTYQDIFTGLYDFTMSEETNLNKVKSAIVRTNLWSKFLSRLETPVDVRSEKDLDGNTVTVFDASQMPLPSQIIRMENKMRQDIFGNSFEEIPDDSYLQLSFRDVELEEIPETYTLPNNYNPVLPVSNITAKYAGEYHFEINVLAYISKISVTPSLEFTYQSVKDLYGDLVDFYLNIDGVEYIFTWSEIVIASNIPTPDYGGGKITKFSYSGTHNVNAKSEIRFYGKMNQEWTDPPHGPGETFLFHYNDNVITAANTITRSDIHIVADTVFPQTVNQGFLIHDLFYNINKRITGEFHSEYLGSPSTVTKQYTEEGCGWKHMTYKGLQLKGFNINEKPFFESFKDAWEGMNPILNLGLGYDVVDGNEVIRIEGKEFFYQTDGSVYLNYAHEIIRRFDEDWIFNQIKYGYKKWESENISGLDDAQTKAVRVPRFKKVGKVIDIESSFMAASLAIENTRRQSIEKSKDYKLDNETFVIAIEEVEGSPGGFIPELDENFSEIDNLLFPETRYNSRITPSRNFARWLNVFNGALQKYLGSVYKFVSGEGNYDVVTELSDPDCGEYEGELDEKGDIPVTTDYLHLPDLFELKVALSWDQYQAIAVSREKGIWISQTDSDHVLFFIKDLQYELNFGRAVIQAWPKTPFFITNTDFIKPADECMTSPVTDQCLDALLTELGEQFITENEDCLILN